MPDVIGNIVLSDPLVEQVFREPIFLLHIYGRITPDLKQQRCTGQVGGLRQVRTVDAVTRTQCLNIESRLVVELLKCKERLGGRLPDIKVLAQQVLHQHRVRLGAFHLVGQRFLVLNGPEARVRLFPAGRIRPLAPLIQFIDDRQHRLIVVPFRIIISVDNPPAFVILQVEDVITHRAGRGCDDGQRLCPGAHAVDNNVVQVLVFDGVQLINQGPVYVQSVQLHAVAAQRLERAIVVVGLYFGYQAFRVAVQRRRMFYHPDGFVPDDFGLVFFGSYGIYLRTAFTVRHQQEVSQGRTEQRLSVLTRDQEYQLTVFPKSGRLLFETEQRGDQRLLPQLQPDRLACPLAFTVAAERLDEGDGVVRSLFIVLVRGFGIVQLVDQVPVCPAHLV